MAMLNVQKNVASEMQELAEQTIALKNRYAVAVAMFNAEGMSSLTDADLQTLPELAHVTILELTAAKNALDAINTAIGDYSAGTNATKLMRIVRVIPK